MVDAIDDVVGSTVELLDDIALLVDIEMLASSVILAILTKLVFNH